MAGHDNNIDAHIALSFVKGLRAPQALQLLSMVGDASRFFSLSTAELQDITASHSPVYDSACRASLLEQGRAEAAVVRDKGIDARFVASDSFPHRLAQCPDAPSLIYTYGASCFSRAHSVAIVGTRHATSYGIDFTTKLVHELAEKVGDLLVVSGLAYGIDVAAHKAAIDADVPTVGVVAHGLSRVYPAEHRQVAASMVAKGGALVTEYTYATGPQPRYFLARNHLIAGLADCVVVVESDIRGGAMSTARTARNYDREVFAVPGRINDLYSRGTNMLIANNTAQLIVDADSLISAMGWESHKSRAAQAPQLFRPLSDQEQQIVDFIKQNPEATVNEMCVTLGMSYASITSVLFQLELDDIISTLPGGRFEVKSII